MESLTCVGDIWDEPEGWIKYFMKNIDGMSASIHLILVVGNGGVQQVAMETTQIIEQVSRRRSFNAHKLITVLVFGWF